MSAGRLHYAAAASDMKALAQVYGHIPPHMYNRLAISSRTAPRVVARV